MEKTSAITLYGVTCRLLAGFGVKSPSCCCLSVVRLSLECLPLAATFVSVVSLFGGMGLECALSLSLL